MTEWSEIVARDFEDEAEMQSLHSRMLDALLVFATNPTICGTKMFMDVIDDVGVEFSRFLLTQGTRLSELSIAEAVLEMARDRVRRFDKLRGETGERVAEVLEK